MNKHKSLYLLPIIAIMFLSSCTVMTKSTPSASLEARVNFTMDNLEYIGDVTGEATQTTLLGIIPVGGRRNHVGTTSTGLGLPASRQLNNALYDALMSKPDADFVLPISTSSVRNVMFLGNRSTLTVRAKAFRIKTK